MKSVLISIRPQWVEKIARGEKTIEVRKPAPKEVPFKAYIYETKGQYIKFIHGAHTKYGYGCGKVIGEFICDRIICSQAYFDSQGKNHLTNVFPDDIKKTCLDEYDLWDYIAGKACKTNEIYDGYLWHISDLKIYDKPKELSEFRKPCDWNYDCCTCKRAKYELTKAEAKVFYGCDSELTRPPQSWIYIEDLGEKNERNTF